MLLEVLRRTNNGVSLRPTERQGDHVAGNETCNPDAQIEPVLDDIDHFSFRDDIDIHVRIAAQKLKHEW